MIVRPATEGDFDRIVEMGQKFWSLTAYAPVIPYSGDAVRYWSHMMLNCGLLFVVEKEGYVLGAAGAVLGPSLGNLEYLVASEMYWYLDESARAAGVGKALLAALEHAAKERGATLMGMMLLEAVNPEVVAAMYGKMGYQPAERTFFKML